MSRDQRPGKIRLVSSGTAPQPQRRATDPKSEVPIAAEAPAPAPAAAPAPVPVPSGSGLLLSCLFLAACAAGGALFILYPPIPLVHG